MKNINSLRASIKGSIMMNFTKVDIFEIISYSSNLGKNIERFNSKHSVTIQGRKYIFLDAVNNEILHDTYFTTEVMGDF